MSVIILNDKKRAYLVQKLAEKFDCQVTPSASLSAIETTYKKICWMMDHPIAEWFIKENAYIIFHAAPLLEKILAQEDYYESITAMITGASPELANDMFKYTPLMRQLVRHNKASDFINNFVKASIDIARYVFNESEHYLPCLLQHESLNHIYLTEISIQHEEIAHRILDNPSLLKYLLSGKAPDTTLGEIARQHLSIAERIILERTDLLIILTDHYTLGLNLYQICKKHPSLSEYVCTQDSLKMLYKNASTKDQ